MNFSSLTCTYGWQMTRQDSQGIRLSDRTFICCVTPEVRNGVYDENFMLIPDNYPSPPPPIHQSLV